jgi:hypothetical protein
MRYWWEIPYVLAILQTNEPSMQNALNEAVAALEQRRLSPVDATEEIALADAEVALKMLTGERPGSASETGRRHVKGEIKEKVGRFGRPSVSPR